MRFLLILTILRVDSIADSLKIVDSAVSEKILLFEKKIGS